MCSWLPATAWRRSSFRVVGIAAVGLGLNVISIAEAAPITREEAVALARKGDANSAIAALRELVSTAPEDDLVAYDLALILTWVGRSREATDAFEKARGSKPPEYVLAAIIRAYRDQKRYVEAERWARTAEKSYPLDVTWAKLLALVWPIKARRRKRGRCLNLGQQRSRTMPRSGWR
ncbi:MAG TPA: hypothetical protein VGI60_11760 [Chthoniobacterales bacterium]